jgi:putative mycofactocin binding protein MftB
VGKTVEPRYLLAKNTVVREEDFGLLFYTMAGPRLFFLGSGKLLGTGFFDGNHTLGQWIAQEDTAPDLPQEQITKLQEGLASLRASGVLVEC